jgi:hypothetical protein
MNILLIGAGIVLLAVMQYVFGLYLVGDEGQQSQPGG